MDGPTEIYFDFDDLMGASAYTVLVIGMAGKDFAPSIAVGPEGWIVNLPKPLPLEMHHAILGGIAHDKKTNPAKWEKAKRDIVEKN